ncbi:MAG: carboxypeptidase-like regulatory domain-containing protein [Ignavibacteriales bacterium]|nr:carboxypeptidase-like regulatory domain-containing protein [Ignavibacteriales bacterium]
MAVKKQILFLFILISFMVFPQAVSVSGKVVDQKTGEPLSFGTLRVVGNKSGTTSNKDGNYELLLKKGKYKIAASFVGYLSDTVEVDVVKSITNVNFSLVSSQVELKEITVFPGENPAFGIIRKAIERKNVRKAIIDSYKFNAYTKGVIRTTNDISASGNRAGQAITLGTASDTGDLKITGIIENVSEAYFKAPSQYKEIITARRQTANVPPFANILTGGRFIANFYEDQIIFFGNNNFIGPIADNSITHYYYYIKDALSIDHKNILRYISNLMIPPIRGSSEISISSTNLLT